MLSGGCFCGRVRYETDGTPFNVTMCHCGDCRRAAAAPAVAWFSVAMAQFRVTAGSLRAFASSPKVRRGFCPDCGTPLTFASDDSPDEIDITVCSLDDPARVSPVDHVWTASAPTWSPPVDALPRHGGSRP